MRVTLEYRTQDRPRAAFGTCLALAGNLLALALCLAAPIALSLAGVWWQSTALIAAGFVAGAFCLVVALLLAVVIVEQICDLTD